MSCTMAINITSQKKKKQQAYSQSNKTTGKNKKLLNEIGEIVDYSNFL